MKKSELRDAVSGIHLNEEVKRDMIKHVKEETERKQKHEKTAKWQKTAAAAAIVVVAGGVVVFPVRAFISSYFKSPAVQVRMEDMAEEESKKLLDDIDNPEYNESDADSYSREYTIEEKARMQNLYQQYKQGVFPEKEIPKAYSKDEAAQYEFCYLVDGFRFCLPKRELTDEELLEIIDFDLKRGYALQERYEEMYADELAGKKEKENAEVEAIVANGGITEEQAIEIARNSLSDIYGITEEGLDLNSYYKSAGEPFGAAEEGTYLIIWKKFAPHENYYFSIGAKDGRIIATENSGESSVAAEGLPVEEAEGKIPELHEKAASFMKEVANKSYEQEYVYLVTYENGTTTEVVSFVFANADGSGYEVSYLWDGRMYSYGEADLSEYPDGEKRTRQMGLESFSVESELRQLNAD